MPRKRPVFVILLFYLLILAVPLYWLAEGEHPAEKSLVEGRVLQSFPSLFVPVEPLQVASIETDALAPEKATIIIGPILDRKFQAGVEQASADQFPWRLSAIRFSKAVDRVQIASVYALEPDLAIPSDLKSGDYVLRSSPMLLHSVARYTPEAQKTIDQRIGNYRALISANPRIHFYAFYLERLPYSPFHPASRYIWNADRGQALAYFEQHKPAELTLAKMPLTSMDDYQRYFFRTDHHWTVKGILKAYGIIHSMLARGYPQISPRLEPERIVTFSGLDFLGSTARETFYPVHGEPFEVAQFNLPSCTALEDGGPVTYNHSQEYLAGKYSTAPYEHHYDLYYGDTRPYLEFHCENGSVRNLLVIGSSYAAPLEQLLAAHYHQAYFVDLRYNKTFALKEFLSDHQVDDLLVVGENDVVFQHLKWLIQP